MSRAPVLVTGASGAIAKWCIRALIDRSVRVRGTVRDTRRRAEVTAGAGLSPDDDRLELVAADLTRDDGWLPAVQGCSGVLHVASPFPLAEPRHREEVVAPARDGTLRVLKAAAEAGVRRVVVTSSIVAVLYPTPDRAGEFTEADWTDPDRRDITAYIASKAVAERAAWRWCEANPGKIELATVNPGLVLGPAADRDLTTSHDLVRMIARGSYPALPRVSYPIVDIRDVAEAHVRALDEPAAAGHRFLVANGNLTMKEIGLAIAAALPDLARKVPKLEVPDTMVRVLALADRSLKAVLPDLGIRRTVSNAQARRILGIEFRPPVEAVAATARSLRDLGLV